MIRRTNRRLTLCWICLCLILAFIWGNSLLPATASGALSDSLKALLSKLFPFLFHSGGSGGGGWLRKLAHFSEFAVLGVCLGWLFAMLCKRQVEQIGLTVVFGVLTACVDETIQRFVPGRNGCLTDVGIDSAGIIAGILLFTIGYLIYNTKYNHLEDLK